MSGRTQQGNGFAALVFVRASTLTSTKSKELPFLQNQDDSPEKLDVFPTQRPSKSGLDNQILSVKAGALSIKCL